MPTVDYVPFATGSGANVEAQTDYAGSAHQGQGFSTGVAKSSQANKVWRQATMMAACMAQLIATILGENVPDDGNLGNLVWQMQRTINLLAYNNFRPLVSSVAYAPSVTFDVHNTNALHPVFDLQILGGNVNSSSLVNYQAGQLITFHIHQDGTGGRLFNAPPNVPMSAISGSPWICNTQTFAVLYSGDLVAASPMMLS